MTSYVRALTTRPRSVPVAPGTYSAAIKYHAKVYNTSKERFDVENEFPLSNENEMMLF